MVHSPRANAERKETVEPRTRAPGIAAVAADPILMIAAMGGVEEITQEQVDSDEKKLEDYEASISRENSVILHHME